jgi:hypothetical protein
MRTEESNNNQEPNHRRMRIKEKRQKQTEQIHNMNDISEKEYYIKTMDYDENEAKAIAVSMMQICE